MSRIVYSKTQYGAVKLMRDIIAKDLADGASSIIRPFLAEDEIDLAIIESPLDLAEAAYDIFEKKNGNAKTLIQVLLYDLNPSFEKHKERVQYLKSFYESNVLKLADYGITIHGDTVAYPVERDLICKAIKALIEHHNSLPLMDQAMTALYLSENKMDLVSELAAIPDFILQNDAYTKEKGEAKTAMAECRKYMKPIRKKTRNIGQFLVGYFHAVPENASDWGYRLDHSVKASVKRRGKVMNQSKKTTKRLVMDSDFLCLGPGPIKIFKGKKVTGTFILLSKGKKLKIKYGYGTVTLVNDSDADDVGYEAMYNY